MEEPIQTPIPTPTATQTLTATPAPIPVADYSSIEARLDKIHVDLLLIFIVVSIYCGYALAERMVRR